MQLTHHDTFALAGYATTEAHKVMQEHGDLLSTFGVDIRLENDGDHDVHLTSHYVSTVYDILGEAIDFEALDIRDERFGTRNFRHMALQESVTTREQVDYWIEMTQNRLAFIRTRIAEYTPTEG